MRSPALLVFVLAGVGACTLRGSLDHLSGAQCIEPSECPGAETPCQTRACEGGLCKVRLPLGLATESQKVADCLENQCDGTGFYVEVTDETDVKNDNNPCTEDVCLSGEAVNLPKEGPCTRPGGEGGVCDPATGECVTCLGEEQECSTPECSDNCLCLEGACLPSSCNNGDWDMGEETDTDCGGICNPCKPTFHCLEPSDCTSLVCTADGCDGTFLCCQFPTCEDGQKNGDETGIDCGQACPVSCETGEGCETGADCASGVCENVCEGVCEYLCKAPTCKDLVKNGTETDEDCGGLGCGPCLPGQACLVDSDCLGNQCRAGPVGLVCSPNCQDGIQNNDEQGVDCGGGCPACEFEGQRPVP